MKDWTEAAKEVLESHFEKLREELKDSEVDPNEVVADIRTHIDNEIANSDLEEVKADNIRELLSKLSPSIQPESVEEEKLLVDVKVQSPKRKGFFKRIAKPLAYLFGVFLPIITVFVELTTRICAQTFFDPLPTLGHAAAYLWVGIGIFIGLRTVKNIELGTCKTVKKQMWAVGISCGIAFVYMLIFIPILPISVMAILAMGLGLCSLSPLFAFIISFRIHRKLKKASHSLGFENSMPLWKGVLTGALFMLLLETPGSVTRVALRMASSDDATTKSKGLSLLRLVGDEKTIAKACYSSRNSFNSLDLLGWILNLNGELSASEARVIYFQVSGKIFNRSAWGSDRGGFTSRVVFDNNQGDTVVGQRLDDLSMTYSSIDSSIDAEAAIAYSQWTMVFKNQSSWSNHEARMQIALPPGSVVSRLTLWVNGEEREAAFASRNKTRGAYESVVRRQRDPVLVTTDGPDRILVQCFPVAPSGGQMKIRFGYSTPLTLNANKDALFALPKILGRNYQIHSNFKHKIWFESKKALSSTFKALNKEHPKDNLFAIRGEVTTQQLNSYESSIKVDRRGAPDVSWSKDLMKDSSAIIRQDIKEVLEKQSSKIVFVLDSSYSMHRHIEAIAEAFKTLPAELSYAVVLASDKGADIVKPFDSAVHNISNHIAGLDCVGGKDNIPALLRAWDLASQNPNSKVIWIHAQQPLVIESVENLINRFDRRPGSIRLIDFQVDTGPNRIAEEMDDIVDMTSFNRFATVKEDLSRMFNNWSKNVKSWRLIRSKVKTKPDGHAKQSSTHLARLWARDRVFDDWNKNKKGNRDTAMAMAASYQLVTPLTGAVVLENASQYAEAGLTPVAPGSVPGIPEPSTWMLLIVMFLFVIYLLWQRKFRAV